MNVLDLYATITMDTSEYEKGLAGASSKMSGFASAVGNGLALAGDAFKGFAKIGAAAVGAVSAGITAITKASISSLAEYEQLTGGVETLFGDSARTIENYAYDAHKTAGMSANEYMETITGFSASLLQSLEGDTTKAAEYANRAVVDMSDNANKMGTDIAMIQNAYQGFAKQNYTMLDNLKLGYGGTKEEMQRLLADAEKISGIKYDVSSFADITEAIHVMQEEMGIAGTTAAEASSTISGSLASVKAQWQNVLVSIGDGWDPSAPVSDFVDTITTASGNLIPALEDATWNIRNLVIALVEEVSDRIPQITGEILPAILDIFTRLIPELSALIPRIVETLSTLLQSALPQIASAAVTIVEGIVQGISESQGQLMQTALDIITILAEGFLQMLPDIVKLGLELIVSLANGIAQSLPELIPTIVDVVLEIVDVLTNPDSIGQLVDSALVIILALADGLIEAIPKLVEAIPEIIINIVDALVENVPKILEAGVTLLLALAEGIIKAIPDLVKEIPRVITAVVDGFERYYSKLWDIGKDMVRGIWEGIQSMASWIGDKVGGFFDDLFGGVKEHEQIHSPSKRWEPLGKFMAQGIGVGWDKEFSHIQDGINKSLDFGSATLALNASAGGAAVGGSFGGTTFSGLTININGANYSDENALAEAISLRLQRMTERRGAAYA